jgi:hypothetical protein
MRAVGSGRAAAFAYDLATSVVQTRQGNPAWAAQERDGFSPIRSDDKFYGNRAGDSQPDWIDLAKVAIPQADEQQRWLANLILTMNASRKPLPRFWYFPNGKKAVVIMTGDDHGNGGTAGRFDQFKAVSPVGCSVANWECVRGTSYMYTNTPISDAQAAQYNADGFEIGAQHRFHGAFPARLYGELLRQTRARIQGVTLEPLDDASLDLPERSLLQGFGGNELATRPLQIVTGTVQVGLQASFVVARSLMILQGLL